MNSLEVIILTSISLLAIFAVVPVVVDQIFYYQAMVETRSFVAFFNAVADSLESDMGSAFAQRYLKFPQLLHGSFEHARSELMRCGHAVVYNTTLIYRSRYISAFGLYRGIEWSRVVNAPDSPIAVAGWGPLVSMAPRIVRYGDVAVVYNITYHVGKTVSGTALYYVVTAPRQFAAAECNLNVGVQRVIVVNVRLELR